jgi:hypothetical protein
MPPGTNHHGTMFGGKVMATSTTLPRSAPPPRPHARRHRYRFGRLPPPGAQRESVCLESFVTWTHRTHRVFVKVVAEDLLTGERSICTTAFSPSSPSTGGNAARSPVIPETELERFSTAPRPGASATSEGGEGPGGEVEVRKEWERWMAEARLARSGGLIKEHLKWYKQGSPMASSGKTIPDRWEPKPQPSPMCENAPGFVVGRLANEWMLRNYTNSNLASLKDPLMFLFFFCKWLANN